METAHVPHEKAKWHVHTRLEKFDDPQALAAAGVELGRKPTIRELDAAVAAGLLKPTEVIEDEGNLLMTEGVNALWSCLTGTGTGTAGQDLTYFDNANAHIGVGNSNAAESAAQTDLQGASKDFQPMEATYPTIAGNQITFRAVFADGEGQFAWEEWGVANNATPDVAGRLLNRKVAANGTKAAGATWTFTVTITIS